MNAFLKQSGIQLNDSELLVLRTLLSNDVPLRPSEWYVKARYTLDQKAHELQAFQRAAANAYADAHQS